LASKLGYTPVILGSAIEGEAREAATVHAGIARQIRNFGQPAAAPRVLLSGGETSVTVRGTGRGGRNAEFLLSLAIALDGMAGVYALPGDTDGIDGTENNAGAIIGPDILTRVSGPSAISCLAQNDGYGFFERAGALLITGPNFTNVRLPRDTRRSSGRQRGRAVVLMWLGYLRVATFMAAIMARRLSALVALIVVPIVFGLLAGHGIDLGPMAVSGISKLAPTATLLLAAFLYFAVMIDVGLFDLLVSRMLKMAGGRSRPAGGRDGPRGHDRLT